MGTSFIFSKLCKNYYARFTDFLDDGRSISDKDNHARFFTSWYAFESRKQMRYVFIPLVLVGVHETFIKFLYYCHLIL